jgi:L-ascorbate metabolism protein UlaG (beta-lactamase superfamily)
MVSAATASDPLAAAREAGAGAGAGHSTLTYLEHNAWLMTLGRTTILVDPLLEGPLDFGLPSAIYSASKRVLQQSGLVSCLPQFEAIVITQGLSDHAHVPTLRALASRGLSCPVIAPPSAAGALKSAGVPASLIRLVKHGQTVSVRGVSVTATKGALVGPPWQARENGYVFRAAAGQPAFPSVYIEPHAEFDASELAGLAPVDAVITPVVGQFLPAFELVHDGSAALALCRALRPKTVVPMGNGEINAVGCTAGLVRSVGTVEEFERMLERSGIGAGLRRASPGEPVCLEMEA